jgi:hypothetical protein
MNDVTITTAGFTLHASDDTIVAYREHIEEALLESRCNSAVVSIRRVCDDAPIAFKPSKRRSQSIEDFTVEHVRMRVAS